MRTTLWCLLAVLAMLSSAASRADAPAAFARMRSLVGEWHAPLPNNGTLLVGSKAVVFADTYYAKATVLPKTKMLELTPSLPAPTLPRIADGHWAEWIRACKGGAPAGSNFEYSARLTETVLLSNLAVRARRRIDWDDAAMKVTNVAEVNGFVTKSYRAGFGV